MAYTFLSTQTINIVTYMHKSLYDRAVDATITKYLKINNTS